MIRRFKHTRMKTCASDSRFMDDLDKGLVAQVEIVHNPDGHDTIVEYWMSYDDKDSDFNKELNTGNVKESTK